MTQTKKPKPGAKDAKSNSTLWWILGGIVGLGLIVALAFSIASEEPVDESLGYGDPTVTGDPLPVYAAGQEDVSVGLTAPTVEGADWEGNPVTIEPNGTPKIIVFLAHWCPHCQADVPVIQQWVNDGNLPDDCRADLRRHCDRQAPSQLATPGLAGGGGLDRPGDHGRPDRDRGRRTTGCPALRCTSCSTARTTIWAGCRARSAPQVSISWWRWPNPGASDADQASRDLIFSRRLTCRSSRENRASRNVVTSSSASDSPITRDPRLSTFTSSCSTI